MRQLFVAALGAGFALSGCGSQTGAPLGEGVAGGNVTVGKNVQVSTAHRTVRHVEVIIGTDPLDSKNLIACSILFWRSSNQITDSTTAAYISRDGGATWILSISDPVGSWDPDCLYDARGRAYFISGTDAIHHRATLQRSDSSGRWQRPFVVSGLVDRPWVTTSGRSLLYVTYIPMERTFAQEMRVSHDGGAHFSRPLGYVAPLPPTLPRIFMNAQPVVLSDGTYLQPIQTLSYELTQNVTSDLVADPKRILSKPDGLIRIARLPAGAHAAQMIHAFDTYGDGGTILTMAADPGSKLFRGRAYLAWADERSGRQQIFVSYSPDDGRTWIAPSVLDDEPFSADFTSGPDDVTPTIAVNKDGVVGVTWEDRRDNSDDLGYYVRFSASLDGGDTWTKSVQVSEAPNTVGKYDEATIPWVTEPVSPRGTVDIRITDIPWLTQGHTAGLAADARGVFHALWIDNRTGIPQMWTAPVSVAGAVTRYGDPSLNAFKDVTSLVRIMPLDCGYDRASGRVWVELRVENTSKRTLRDLKLRIVSLRSPLGTAVAGQPTYTLFGRSLAPGAKSVPLRLALDLSNMRPEHQGGFSISTLAELNVRVLAHVAAGNRSRTSTR